MNFIKNSNQVLDERAKKERKNKTGNKQSDYLAPKESTNSKNSSIKNIIGDVIHSYLLYLLQLEKYQVVSKVFVYLQ